MKPAIIIPAYNAHSSIQVLLQRTLAAAQDIPVYVIDDGSDPPIKIHTDCRLCNYYRHDRNFGKGQALLTGMNLARENGATHAVTMDADLQHPPEMITSFLEHAEKCTIVLGRRRFSGSMPCHRRLSNRLTSLMISSQLNCRISDTQCGFRCYDLASVLKYPYLEKGFMFESEVLLKVFSEHDTTMKEVDIETIYPGTGSHIRNFTNTLEFCRLLIRNWFA